MAVTNIVKPAAPSLQSFEFGTYNEAVAYARKCAALAPSKPYKRLRGDAVPVWCVSLVNPAAIKARPAVVRVEHDGPAPAYMGLKLAGVRACAPVNLRIEV